MPHGTTFSFDPDDKTFFPGTRRQVSVYVPAQYTGDKPACLYVGLDGLGLDVTKTFDQLIATGEVPIVIGVGVQWGLTPSATGHGVDPRYNRSLEFDGLDDKLGQLIQTEVLPAVERRQLPDGRRLRISDDPNDRCTGGASTGGIAAFTLAWQHPDRFRRVYTAIGTFVDMRGGDRYPALVRQTETQPIRVFQQDNDRDEWDGGPEVGDWALGNRSLERALDFAGYEHAHSWGVGGHSGANAAAGLPDAMRFLWRDWPKPVGADRIKSGNVIFKQTIDPHVSWEAVPGVGPGGDHLAEMPDGSVVVGGNAHKRVAVDGTVTDVNEVPFQAFGVAADGQFVTANDLPGVSIIAPNAAGRPTVVSGVRVTGVTVTAAGDAYAVTADGRLWLVRHDGSRVLLDEQLKRPTGVAVSPDGLWLAVLDGAGHTGRSYQVKADGTVQFGEDFYRVHVPDDADDAGVTAICFDHGGRLYAATRMGVQIVDRSGRPRGILPLPGGAAAVGVCFGDAQSHTLFALTDRGLFRRHMNTTGAPPFAAPFKLEPWGPG